MKPLSGAPADEKSQTETMSGLRGRSSSPVRPATGPRGAQVGALQEVSTEHYEIEGEAGRGGIGVVYRARDLRLGRVVAVKELQGQNAAAQARFEREMRITARLQHPGVVPVHEAGRWPTGEPFYAMKLVEGRPLKELIAERSALEQRLALLPHVLAVADTMAYAHGHGVIHRDLKPSNVIVGAYGETVVIDWGLAKDLNEAAADGEGTAEPYRVPAAAPNMTVSGAVLGTPAYMAPEQARGETVFASADVYSLGALLYHVVAGQPPYRGSTPAEVLGKLLARPPVPLVELVPTAPPDLAAIVAKAMERDPAARYATAAELAEDLRRFQTGQLVRAYQYSIGALVRRWIRRHRALVALAVVALAVVVLVSGLSIRRVFAARDRAESARVESERRARDLILERAQGLAKTDPTMSLVALQSYPTDGERWREALWLALDARARGVASQVLHVHEGPVTALAFSRSGRYLFSASTDHRVVVWDVVERRIAKQLEIDLPKDSELWYGAFLEAEQANTVGFLADGHVVTLIDGETLETRSIASCPALVRSIALSPDARLLACEGGGELRVVDVAADSASRVPVDGQVTALDFSRGGERLYVALADGRLATWSLSAGVTIRDALPGHPWAAYVRARGLSSGVIASYSDGGVREWRDGLRAPVTLLEPGRTNWTNPIVSPDGSHVALLNGGFTFQVYDREAGQLVTSPIRTVGSFVLLDARGRALVGSTDGRVLGWDVHGQAAWTLKGHADGIGSIASAHGNPLLATASEDGEVRIWAGDPGGARRAAKEVRSITTHAIAGRDRFATVTSSGVVVVWDTEMRTLASTSVGASVDAIAMADQSEFLAVATPWQRLMVLRPHDRAPLGEWPLPARAERLSISSDGSQVSATLTGGEVVVLRARDGDWGAAVFDHAGKTKANQVLDRVERWLSSVIAPRCSGQQSPPVIRRVGSVLVAICGDGLTKLVTLDGARAGAYQVDQDVEWVLALERAVIVVGSSGEMTKIPVDAAALEEMSPSSLPIITGLSNVEGETR